MTVCGNRFNQKTREYDIPIGQCEVVTISDSNVQAEENTILNT